MTNSLRFASVLPPARSLCLALVAMLSLSCSKTSDDLPGSFARPAIPFAPRQYLCQTTVESLVIDGRLDEDAWQQAPWTELFIDIEGATKPEPRFRTQARMLWDETYFYVGAWMIEPHVWGTLTERDAVIFHDNDFEVFIDPDGDTHEYYELEINALGTEWDLFLVQPYRDGGPAINAWDIQGLKSAVGIKGSLNDPSDLDSGWSVEIAIPWSVLGQSAHRKSPPADGDRWRVNFSRVEWQHIVQGDTYVKKTDSLSGKPLPEDNWVWSPQGLINMHYPEMWGIVQFDTTEIGSAASLDSLTSNERANWLLRLCYYAQRDYQSAHDRYANCISALQLEDEELSGYAWPPQVEATASGYEIWLEATAGNGVIGIRQDGRIFRLALE